MFLHNFNQNCICYIFALASLVINVQFNILGNDILYHTLCVCMHVQVVNGHKISDILFIHFDIHHLC